MIFLPTPFNNESQAELHDRSISVIIDELNHSSDAIDQFSQIYMKKLGVYKSVITAADYYTVSSPPFTKRASGQIVHGIGYPPVTSCYALYNGVVYALPYYEFNASGNVITYLDATPATLVVAPVISTNGPTPDVTFYVTIYSQAALTPS